MTTTQPSLASEIAKGDGPRDADALDAPVSGGDVGARNARLSIMVGGDAGAVERVRPLLERMGKTMVHEGGPGAGQHTKMCNQIVIAGTMIGVCERLLYGRRRASISSGCCRRSAAAPPAAGRSTTSPRGS